jgi:hypothetical protein
MQLFFFRNMDGVYEAKNKLWIFHPKQRNEIKQFFLKDRASFTLS